LGVKGQVHDERKKKNPTRAAKAALSLQILINTKQKKNGWYNERLIHNDGQGGKRALAKLTGKKGRGESMSIINKEVIYLFKWESSRGKFRKRPAGSIRKRQRGVEALQPRAETGHCRSC